MARSAAVRAKLPAPVTASVPRDLAWPTAPPSTTAPPAEARARLRPEISPSTAPRRIGALGLVTEYVPLPRRVRAPSMTMPSGPLAVRDGTRSMDDPARLNATSSMAVVLWLRASLPAAFRVMAPVLAVSALRNRLGMEISPFWLMAVSLPVRGMLSALPAWLIVPTVVMEVAARVFKPPVMVREARGFSEPSLPVSCSRLDSMLRATGLAESADWMEPSTPT